MRRHLACASLRGCLRLEPSPHVSCRISASVTRAGGSQESGICARSTAPFQHSQVPATKPRPNSLHILLSTGNTNSHAGLQQLRRAGQPPSVQGAPAGAGGAAQRAGAMASWQHRGGVTHVPGTAAAAPGIGWGCCHGGAVLQPPCGCTSMHGRGAAMHRCMHGGPPARGPAAAAAASAGAWEALRCILPGPIGAAFC